MLNEKNHMVDSDSTTFISSFKFMDLIINQWDSYKTIFQVRSNGLKSGRNSVPGKKLNMVLHTQYSPF